MNSFTKIESFFILVFIFSQIFAETEDISEFSFYGKKGKTHVKPNTRPTEPPEEELEPESNPNTKPEPQNTFPPEITLPEWEPGFTQPDDSWQPIIVTQKPKPESGWHPVIITSSRPEPERSTPRRTTRPEPEWTFPSRRTTPRPRPELTAPTRRTTPWPEPERTTRRTTPRPEPEPERTTTRRTPEPETTTRRPRPEPENGRHTTTRRPLPTPDPEMPPGVPQGCQNIRCRAGYRCDCMNPCPATCKNPNRTACATNVCKVGCVCDKGYVLNENITCVPIKECQKQPINGQIVCNELCTDGKQCGCENPCPATCTDPDPPPCPSIHCNAGCYTVCRKGFVLDRIGGDCIPLQYCPNRQCISQSCAQHENEIYYDCSTRFCNRTCETPNLWCGQQCVKPGNFDCKPGYLRDLRDGRCVLHQQCNQAIRCDRKDETFYECDTRMCQRTCQRPNPKCTDICYQPGNCDCKLGLVRDIKTCRCVDKNESSCRTQRVSDD